MKYVITNEKDLNIMEQSHFLRLVITNATNGR